MNYSVNFLEMTVHINPLTVVQYLKDTGWKIFPRKNEAVKVLQYKTENELLQVNVPMDKALLDYKEAMYESIVTLAKLEKKSLETVFLYLMNPNADILKIRLERQDVEVGNILLDDAINIYENTKKLLSAAAQDVLHPKKYHQGRVDTDIQKFLSECRFGQTEVGSYVVSVVCPFVNEDILQTSIFADEDEKANSLTRKVTSRVMENLARIKTHIDEGDLASLTQEPISVNFYEAVKGLNLQAEGARVEFRAEWSPSIRNNPTANQSVLLTHDYCQPMESVIQKLKGHTKKTTAIVGRIKKLESSPDAKNRDKGRITVTYLDENNKARTLVTDLDAGDYARALEAHGKGWYVQLTGELSTKKNVATMRCESFDVIGTES